MNKQEFIDTLLKWCSDNQISLNQVHVSHGGSMLMLGLRETTNDIDLTVDQSVWDKFDGKGFPSKDLEDYRKLYEVTDKIDIHLAEKEDVVLETDSSGIFYRSAEETLSNYRSLNRPKDRDSVSKLNRYIHQMDF